VESGCPPNSPALSAIGYREMAAVLREEMTLEEAVVQIKRLTRRYVRQQGAWFREEDATIHWFQADPNPAEEIVQLIENYFH
jgi:tRNA dimethylallyltransferase